MTDLSKRDAGRELDAEVAERVLGLVHFSEDGTWRNEVDEGKFAFVCLEENLPRYSTDVAAAFYLVADMRAKGCDISIETIGDGWGVKLDSYARYCDTTFPLAACRASLARARSVTTRANTAAPLSVEGER